VVGREGVVRSKGGDVERVFRDEYGRAVATLVGVFGDITLAEDAVQDAFGVATERWRQHGIPPNPGGWIVTTARNRAIDVVRRTNRGRELQAEVAGSAPTSTAGPDADGGQAETVDGVVSDDRLRLIFTCCHPSLRTEHQVALTLRLVGGLSVAETARSFVVGE
jgi:RNA polymerase sigma-70 factor (ECF subfamily)